MNDKEPREATDSAEPEYHRVDEIVRKVLGTYAEDKIPEELTLEEFTEFFTARPLRVTIEALLTKVTLELPIRDLVALFIAQLQSAHSHIPIKFTETVGDLDLTLPENETVIWSLAETAVIYYLGTINKKIGDALNALFEESLRVSIQYNAGRYAQHIATKSDYIPLENDLRPLLEELRTREDALNRHRITEVITKIGGLRLEPAKGRPRTWTKESLLLAVSKASTQFRKEKYRPPTLNEVATAISRKYPDRMSLSGKALGQMLKRYELSWKDIKNPHN